MNIIISNSDKRPIYQQILTQIREQILLGRLREGDRLPSIRALAKELKISVITTKRAYDELENQGLIETVQGKGTFVSTKNKEFLKEEHMKSLELHLKKAIEVSRFTDISKEEMLDLFNILYEE